MLGEWMRFDSRVEAGTPIYGNRHRRKSLAFDVGPPRRSATKGLLFSQDRLSWRAIAPTCSASFDRPEIVGSKSRRRGAKFIVTAKRKVGLITYSSVVSPKIWSRHQHSHIRYGTINRESPWKLRATPQKRRHCHSEFYRSKSKHQQHHRRNAVNNACSTIGRDPAPRPFAIQLRPVARTTTESATAGGCGEQKKELKRAMLHMDDCQRDRELPEQFRAKPHFGPLSRWVASNRDPTTSTKTAGWARRTLMSSVKLTDGQGECAEPKHAAVRSRRHPSSAHAAK